MKTNILVLLMFIFLIISENSLISPFTKGGYRGIIKLAMGGLFLVCSEMPHCISISPNLAIAGEIQETITLNVRGMSCSQCTKRVEGELKKINGVKNSEASLKEAKVKITFEKGKVTAEQLTEAINNMGYWVEKKR